MKESVRVMPLQVRKSIFIKAVMYIANENKPSMVKWKETLFVV